MGKKLAVVNSTTKRKSINKEGKNKFNLLIEDDLKQRLTEKMAKNGHSNLSSFMRHIFNAFLDAEKWTN